jgi:hypothetical protein
MFKTIHITILILFCASLAAAQSTDYKKIDFYAGYSAGLVVNSIGDDSIPDDPQDYHGLDTSITRNFSRYAGLKFNFSVLKIVPDNEGLGTIRDSHLYNFVGGVQLKDNSSEKTFKPFVHALVGVAHIHHRFNLTNHPTESDTGLAGVFGGGIDLRVSDRLDVRIIQFDYTPMRLFDSSQPSTRFGIGIVFH